MEENYLHCRTEPIVPEVGRKVALITGITGKHLIMIKIQRGYWKIPNRSGWFLPGGVPPRQGLHRAWDHQKELLLQHGKDLPPVRRPEVPQTGENDPSLRRFDWRQLSGQNYERNKTNRDLQPRSPVPRQGTIGLLINHQLLFYLSKVSFDLAEYTAEVDGVGTLRLLDAIRTCGLSNTIRWEYQKFAEIVKIFDSFLLNSRSQWVHFTSDLCWLPMIPRLPIKKYSVLQ